MFSVCTVTYGDYPELIRRTLESITVSIPAESCVKDIRIGLNEVSDASFQYVMDWAGRFGSCCPVLVYRPVGNANVGKYPLMRRMFQEEPSVFSRAEFVMWLDDDSYFDLREPIQAWWDNVHHSLEEHTVVGLTHYMMSRGNQYVGISKQPWYTGKTVPRRHRFKFATGAWWATHSSFLKKWDYPFLEIYHNGGDSILGELCRQQEAPIHNFTGAQCHAKCCYKGADRNDVVHVNVGGREERRGIGKKKSEEVFPWNFYGVKELSYKHHNFDLEVYKFDGVRK